MNHDLQEIKRVQAVIVWVLVVMALANLLFAIRQHLQDKRIESQEKTERQPQPISFVEATAYTSCEEECGDNPNITATGLDLRTTDLKVVAVSRSLEQYLPMHSKVRIITDDKILDNYVVEDKMSSRITWPAVDILMKTKAEAKEFGNQEVVVGRY